MMKEHVKSAVLTTFKLSLLLAFGLAIACKKDSVPSPNVSFIEPAFVATYSFGDTITVRASISHPQTIERITLTLVDASFKSVEPVESLPVSGSSVTINSTIIIQNKRIESGKHYIRIQVRVAGELFNSFQEVNISGLQTQSIGTFALTSSGLNRRLYKITGNQAQVFFDGFGDASGIAVNSFYGGVYTAPAATGDLLLFSTVSDSLIWSERNTASSGAPFMQGLGGTNEESWGFYGEGSFKGYGNTGGISFAIQLPNSYRGVDAIRFGDTYFILAQELGGNTRSLLFYSALTKSFLRERILPAGSALIGLVESDSKCFVFYNTSADEAEWTAFTLNGTQVSLPSLPNLSFTAVSEGPNNEIVFGTDQGVYRYTPNPVNFLPISPIAPTVLAFDDVNNQLWLGTSTSVSQRTYPNMQLINAFPFQDSLVDVAILFNK